MSALKTFARRVLGPAAFDELGVVHATVSGDGPPGVLVDVGAHLGSSMAPFVADGWRVYAFEPASDTRSELERDPMTHSPRVVIDPRAIAERDGDHVALYTSEVSSGISTLAPFHPSHRVTEIVETVRLDTFIANQGIETVTVIKTDTEGFDLQALETFPWDRIHPIAVVCEFEDRKTVPLGYRYGDLVAFLANQGYRVLVSEWYPVVEYGQQHRWRSIRPTPSPLADPGAWGNLVAVEPRLWRRLRRKARIATVRLRLRRVAQPASTG